MQRALPWCGSGTSLGSLNKHPVEPRPGARYEARLLDDVCAPGGARAAPPQEALNNFCKRCESLDSQKVPRLPRENQQPSDGGTVSSASTKRFGDLSS